MCCYYFSLACVVAELLAILGLFTKKKLQTHAAIWWQNLAADLSWFDIYGSIRLQNVNK